MTETSDQKLIDTHFPDWARNDAKGAVDACLSHFNDSWANDLEKEAREILFMLLHDHFLNMKRAWLYVGRCARNQGKNEKEIYDDYWNLAVECMDAYTGIYKTPNLNAIRTKTKELKHLIENTGLGDFSVLLVKKNSYEYWDKSWEELSELTRPLPQFLEMLPEQVTRIIPPEVGVRDTKRPTSQRTFFVKYLAYWFNKNYGVWGDRFIVCAACVAFAGSILDAKKYSKDNFDQTIEPLKRAEKIRLTQRIEI